MAAILLHETPWNVDAIGEAAFLQVASDGAIACASPQIGETTPEHHSRRNTVIGVPPI